MARPKVKVKTPRPLLVYDDLQLFLKDLTRDFDVEVTTHIISEGPAAAYALVWEFGNLRQTKEGPKTTLGINPNGEVVWLTIQAPMGYIRVLSPTFRHIIKDELKKIDFGKKMDKVEASLSKAVTRMGKSMLKELRATVPIDTEQLKDSLKVLVNGRLVEVGED